MYKLRLISFLRIWTLRFVGYAILTAIAGGFDGCCPGRQREQSGVLESTVEFEAEASVGSFLGHD